MNNKQTYKLVILNSVLKKLMDSESISTSKLAKETGILIDTIELMLDENRQHYDLKDLSIVIFIRIATYFNVTIDYLLYGISEQKELTNAK